MIRAVRFVGCALRVRVDSAQLKSRSKFQFRAHQIPATRSARAGAAVDALSPILRRKWLLDNPDSQLRRLKVTAAAGELIVVQDDLLHPVLGGNKLRKLDGLLPEVKATGCTDLLTCGGLQSAHTAAVAAACAEQGIKAHLLVRGERPATPTGFHLLARMFAQVTYIPRSEYADRSAMFKKYAQQIKDSTPTDMKVRRSQLLCWGASALYTGWHSPMYWGNSPSHWLWTAVPG
ncbi:hypothetical protein ABBQ38_008333 [Trebouxia sp. C0009 RCD-2024]